MPLLRANHLTNWSAVANSPDVIVGTRDHRDERYVILSNSMARPLEIEISFSGLPCTPGMLTDYFSGEQIRVNTRSLAATAPLSLDAHGTAVYRVDVQLVPPRNP
jgi:hypothetical protein